MGKFKKFRKQLPDVTGKVFVITGTTSGIGYSAAKTVAECGGEVVLLNRASERSDKAVEKLRKEVPSATFSPIACDLQNFDSVRAAAEKILSSYETIYCLANNAGVMALKDKATGDGYDVQMQTNHLSHFLLTAMLFPRLQAGAAAYGDARIVHQSSGGRHGDATGKLGREGWGLEAKYLGPNGGNLGGDDDTPMYLLKGPHFERYFHSKLANSVFMHALDKKMSAGGDTYKGIRSVGCQPGVTNTGLLDMGSKFANMMGSVFKKLMQQTVEDGSIGLLTGMLDPDAVSGALYGPKNQEKGPVVINEPEAYETDSATMEMLWAESEKATGVTFTV